METLKERIAFHEKCLKELEESGRNTMTFTDPESAMMPAKEGGIKACYNVQTAVDAKSHMIVDFHITDSPSDKGQLCTSMQMCMKDLKFLCKGKEKVTAEFSLSALAYNIRRAINICGGVQNLIDRYRRKAMPKIRKIAEF